MWKVTSYYDPVVGRFINADDTEILEYDQESILENNLFAYGLNNPITNADYMGYFAIPAALLVILIGAVAVSLSAMLNDSVTTSSFLEGVEGLWTAVTESATYKHIEIQVEIATEFIAPLASSEYNYCLFGGGLSIIDNYSVLAGGISGPLGPIINYFADAGDGITEHKKRGTTNKSNKKKHEKGQKRKDTDKPGGEKGDLRRPYRKPPRKR